MRGFVLKLPDLKLGENWIFIFQPMDKGKSGRNHWVLFILGVQFMQVFNGKKYQFGLSKPWIYFGICLYPGPLLEIQHKTRLQRGWVSESPENLTFRWIYLQDDPRRGNHSKASEHVAEWLSEACFFHMFTFIRNCDGAGSLSGQVSPEFSGLRWVCLSGFSSCPSVCQSGSQHTPEGLPTSSSGTGACLWN